MKKILASLVVMLWMLTAQNVFAQTAMPMQDATIALTSSGGDLRDPHLHVKYQANGQGVNQSQEAVIQFDLGIVPAGVTAAQIQEAELVLYIDPSSVTPGTITICELAKSPTWTTGTITGTNLPVCNTGAQVTSFNVSSNEVNNGGFVLVNITPMVRDWISGAPNNGIMLQADSATVSSADGGVASAVNARIDSMKDNGSGYPPQLQIILQQQGPVGPAGPAGAQGPQGLPGPSGTVGPGGITGPQGPQGLQGSVGPAGATGATGPMGPTGATGATGPSGQSFNFIGAFNPGTAYASYSVVTYGGGSYIATQSNAGAITPDQDSANWSVIAMAGQNGQNGVPGLSGANGKDGAAGVAGAQGPAGPQGLPGAPGATGAVGPAGAVGATGAQGLTGAQGPIGLTGATGAAGAAGAVGAIGPQGPIGLTGAVGPVGPAGVAGAAGIAGVAGANGKDGIDGAVGPQGPSGPAGANGGLSYKGTWAANTTYNAGDLVLYAVNNSLGVYLNISGSDSSSPDQDSANWAKLTSTGGTAALPPTCPSGYSGTPPNCVAPPPPDSIVGQSNFSLSANDMIAVSGVNSFWYCLDPVASTSPINCDNGSGGSNYQPTVAAPFTHSYSTMTLTVTPALSTQQNSGGFAPNIEVYVNDNGNGLAICVMPSGVTTFTCTSFSAFTINAGDQISFGVKFRGAGAGFSGSVGWVLN